MASDEEHAPECWRDERTRLQQIVGDATDGRADTQTAQLHHVGLVDGN